MQILILNEDNLNLNQFCLFLIDKIKKEFILKLQPYRYEQIKKYLNQEGVIDFIGAVRKIEPIIILKQIINNLQYRKQSNNEYIIDLNATIRLYGTNTLVLDIVKLIEYGNSELFPIPLIRNIFRNIEENLTELYMEFERM